MKQLELIPMFATSLDRSDRKIINDTITQVNQLTFIVEQMIQIEETKAKIMKLQEEMGQQRLIFND
jgi:hypothetical protein